MTHRITTDDVRIDEIRPLAAPIVLIEQLMPSERDERFVSETRCEAENIMKGMDNRLLVIVGPCSIHDLAGAIDYAHRLKALSESVQDSLLLVMRVYFEKPRTTVGWKGLINDPHLDETFDINHGLRSARELLLRMAQLGVPSGTEFLDTIIPQYIADLVSWGAIGARTTESQVHRELASGLSMPVGFKNATNGNITVAIDALRAARHPHSFLSVTKEGLSAIVKTKGNDACHIILRGSNEGPNYEPGCITRVAQSLEQAGLPPHLMVDCSHGNSGKDHRNQPKVADSIAGQIGSGSRCITGVMLESNLVEGSQSPQGSPLTYGQSITDACMDWETTHTVLERLAAAARLRSKNRSL